ncbi:MAG: hypothetical protein J6J78_01035 [Clostridia bacterium]|nr:hypothetical protein [Clostridia bacterium]MBP3651639.1 hypothetical protein [Clostridia bacterium]
MKSRRRGIVRALAVTLVVFAILLSGAILLLDYIGNASDEAQIAMVRDAVRSAVTTCYAVEGAYPRDISYLEENYGLAYDHERFFITYDAFASNIFPDILVNLKGASDT